MIKKILHFSIHHPFEILFLTLACAVYGLYSLFHLPIDAVPDITNNQVQINMLLPGYSPAEMEKQVTYPIENALAGIPGLESTRSLSRNAFAQVTAIFRDHVDIYFARQQITERLNEVKQELPEGTEIRMGPISTGLSEVSMWSVEFAHPHGVGATVSDCCGGWQSDGSYLTPEGEHLRTPVEQAAYLRTVQDWIVKPQLKGIPDLAGVDSIGGFVKQYHIQPNLEQLIALGLTLEELVSIVQKNNASIGPGYIERGGEGLLLKVDERLRAADEIGSIIVATRNGVPTYLSDIAEIGVGKEMRTGSASKNGEETVIGTALMLIGANSRTVAERVAHRLDEIKKTLPPDVIVTPVLTRTKLVDATVETVFDNLFEGAVLVIVLLFIFLGQMRAALITACVIPLSMLFTAIGMVQSKISGNLMSLGAIDFGLIVDGAVIITENCLRRLSMKRYTLERPLTVEERRQEVVIASDEMIRPTIFGQLIIMLVYIPMLTLEGIEGKMFHPMAATVLYALIAAFILSVTFIPAMIGLLMTLPSDGEREGDTPMMRRLKDLYARTLDLSLSRPFIITGAASALFLSSLFLFTQLGQEFVPTLDEIDIALQAMRIPSTSLTQSTEMQRDVERTLIQLPEVAYVFSKTGTAEMASDPMPPNLSDTFVILKPCQQWENPKLTKEELIEKMEEALSVLTGNGFEFTQPIEMRFNELISGVRTDVAIKVYGDAFDKMQQTAEKIFSIVEGIPGAADVKMAQTEGLPVLHIEIDRAVASTLGLNAADILDVIAIATGGGHAGVIFEGDRRFELLVRMPESERNDLNALNRLPIPLKTGKGKFSTIPLQEVAKLHISEGLNEIQRENGKRFVSVMANVRGRDLLSFVKETQKAVTSQVKIPDGYWIEWGGEFEQWLSAKQRLEIVIPICLIVILFLLYTALGTLREALIVFSGVPFALTGGILALWLRELPFSISSAVGFIALSGIAVLNGLVLMTATAQRFKLSNDYWRAVKEGAIVRLRPVLMTALVASLGFIPMALATGTGAEVQRPLATVVIGGLISSTALTLLVLPALCLIFIPKGARVRSPKNQIGERVLQ